MGHIHSHNTMDTYFSGVDMSELNDNSEFHNYYLSLIVNNFMKMKAKVAFRGSNSTYECKNEKGETWNLRLAETAQTMFVFDCDIISDRLSVVVDDAFAERTEFIIRKEAEKKKVFRENLDRMNFKPQGKTYGKYGYPKEEDFTGRKLELPKGMLKDIFDQEDEDYEEQEVAMVEFVNYVLNLGEYRLEPYTIEETVDDLIASDLNPSIYAGKLMGDYPDMYEKHFRNTPNAKSLTMEDFVRTTSEMIEMLEEFEGYPIIERVNKNLGLMLSKLLTNA